MYYKLGKHIFLHKSFLFLPLVFLTYNKKEFYIVMLASAFLHEAAHFAAAVKFKEVPDKIFISPYGFELRLVSATPTNEIVILLSGPLLSFLLSAFGLALGFQNIFRANLYLFVLNLLPAYPLDGGKLLKIALWHIYGVCRGNKILKKVSYILAFFLYAASVCFTSVWIFIVATLIVKRTKGLRGTPFYRKRRKFTPLKIIRASSSYDVMEILRLFSPYYYLCVYVDDKNIMLTERDIVTIIERGKYTIG